MTALSIWAVFVSTLEVDFETEDGKPRMCHFKLLKVGIAVKAFDVRREVHLRNP